MAQVKIRIDGQELAVEQGKTVLEAALDAGIYIPHFCYHKHLPIRGSCRMCLVWIEKTPKLQAACSTPVAEGMAVETGNDEVKKARQSVLEFMLKNHPVDCPVCDKAGECALQDYYMDYDARESRLSYRDKKVKKGKRLAMGPTLVLDQERCILCHRCIRFMRDLAGNECLTDARRADRTVITAFPGEQVIDPYSLNLTDICPVGAWTARHFRFKKRVWLLTGSPSVCTACARGCNVFLDHEKNIVYRMRPRESVVNRTWLCDEGRLCFQAINGNRLTRALLREQGALKEISPAAALDEAARMLSGHKGKVLGLVSASVSSGNAELFARLIKGLGGRAAYYCRKSGKDDSFLRRADRDCNLKGVSGVGIEELAGRNVVKFELVVLLESLLSEPVAGAAGKKMIALSPNRSEMVEGATLSLPIASYAESAGVFVNFEGVRQEFGPALALEGDSKPARWALSELARRLGVEI